MGSVLGLGLGIMVILVVFPLPPHLIRPLFF